MHFILIKYSIYKASDKTGVISQERIKIFVIKRKKPRREHKRKRYLEIMFDITIRNFICYAYGDNLNFQVILTSEGSIT